MKLKLFEAQWFCHGEWGWQIRRYLAENEQQIIDEIEREGNGNPDWKHSCKGECRTRPYSSKKEDTLKIKFVEEVTLPYWI